jgi:hypothetical protein
MQVTNSINMSHASNESNIINELASVTWKLTQQHMLHENNAKNKHVIYK